MSEEIVEILDYSDLIRAAWIGGVQYVAVWYGGTTVNVYHPRSEWSDAWREITVFTVQDDQGRAPDPDVIEEAIEDKFEAIAHDADAEVRYGGAYR